MSRKLLSAACVAMLCAGAPVLSFEAKDQIKHRHAVMEAIGGHFSAIFATLRAPESVRENITFHTQSIVALSRISVDTFPEGTAEGKTDARPEIWEKPEEFKQAMDLFLTRADGLAKAAEGGDVGAIAAAAKNLGGACKGCHDDFKKD